MTSEKYNIALLILLLVISVSILKIVTGLLSIWLCTFLSSGAEKYFSLRRSSGAHTNNLYLKEYTRPPPFPGTQDHNGMNGFISLKTQIP